MNALDEKNVAGDLAERRELNHFLNLVSSGKYRGASGGARSARKIAKTFVDCGLILDGAAVQGLCEFICIAKARPEAARDVVGW